MVSSVNFRYFSQMKIIQAPESRPQQYLLMKCIMLKQWQEQKLLFNHARLWSVYIGNKKWDQISEWDNFSKFVHDFKRFGTLATMNVSNHVSESFPKSVAEMTCCGLVTVLCITQWNCKVIFSNLFREFVSFSGFSERAEQINLVPSTSFCYKRKAKKEVKFALGTRLRSNTNRSFTDRVKIPISQNIWFSGWLPNSHEMSSMQKQSQKGEWRF